MVTKTFEINIQSVKMLHRKPTNIGKNVPNLHRKFTVGDGRFSNSHRVSSLQLIYSPYKTGCEFI